jgi:hypothetical protein
MEEEQQGLVRRRHGRVLHEVLHRAGQDKYGPRGQGPLTAPEMKKIRTTLQTPSQSVQVFLPLHPTRAVNLF